VVSLNLFVNLKCNSIDYKYKSDGAKGFGFTLKGKDDFRLDKFNKESPCENFELCYGEGKKIFLKKRRNWRHHQKREYHPFYKTH
jgi:hypothetical protein